MANEAYELIAAVQDPDTRRTLNAADMKDLIARLASDANIITKDAAADFVDARLKDHAAAARLIAKWPLEAAGIPGDVVEKD